MCPAGPPGQVASLAGKKDGMKQGELSGILKELGYTPEQVDIPKLVVSNLANALMYRSLNFRRACYVW